MTAPDEPEKPCIRGCTKPGPLMPDGERAPDVPVPATEGLLCGRDAQKLRTWLTEIPDLYATLDPRKEGGYSTRYDGKTGKTGGLSHSPALVRLEVVALQDPRTKHDNDNETEPFYIPRIIAGWAWLLAQDNHLTSPTDTLTEATDLLIRWWTTLIKRPDIDELWDTARRAHQLLKHANHIEGPKPVGHCITLLSINGRAATCGRELFAPVGEPVRCPNCKRQYDGLELVRLADSREQAERSFG